MRKLIRRLATGIVVALAPMAIVTVATPGVSSAQCENGWWWNPDESGRGFFIDHGAGVVLGETVEIGEDVTIFHQVTLGAVGWWHDNQRPEGSRRHPKLGDRVVVGANATLLGPITVGPDSVVGAQALVIRDVPADSRVLAPFSIPNLRSSPGAAKPRQPVVVAGQKHKGAAAFPSW